MTPGERRFSTLLLCLAIAVWVAGAGLAGYLWYVTKHSPSVTQTDKKIQPEKGKE